MLNKIKNLYRIKRNKRFYAIFCLFLILQINLLICLSNKIVLGNGIEFTDKLENQELNPFVEMNENYINHFIYSNHIYEGIINYAPENWEYNLSENCYFTLREYDYIGRSLDFWDKNLDNERCVEAKYTFDLENPTNININFRYYISDITVYDGFNFNLRDSNNNYIVKIGFRYWDSIGSLHIYSGSVYTELLNTINQSKTWYHFSIQADTQTQTLNVSYFKEYEYTKVHNYYLNLLGKQNYEFTNIYLRTSTLWNVDYYVWIGSMGIEGISGYKFNDNLKFKGIDGKDDILISIPEKLFNYYEMKTRMYDLDYQYSIITPNINQPIDGFPDFGSVGLKNSINTHLNKYIQIGYLVKDYNFMKEKNGGNQHNNLKILLFDGWNYLGFIYISQYVQFVSGKIYIESWLGIHDSDNNRDVFFYMQEANEISILSDDFEVNYDLFIQENGKLSFKTTMSGKSATYMNKEYSDLEIYNANKLEFYFFSNDGYYFDELPNSINIGCLNKFRVLTSISDKYYSEFQKTPTLYIAGKPMEIDDIEPPESDLPYWEYSSNEICFDTFEQIIVGSDSQRQSVYNESMNVNYTHWEFDYPLLTIESSISRFYVYVIDVEKEWGDWGFELLGFWISFNWLRDFFGLIINGLIIFLQFMLFCLILGLNWIIIWVFVGIIGGFFWNFLIKWLIILVLILGWFICYFLLFLWDIIVWIGVIIWGFIVWLIGRIIDFFNWLWNDIIVPFLQWIWNTLIDILVAFWDWLWNVIIVPLWEWFWNVFFPIAIEIFMMVLIHIISVLFWIITLGQMDYQIILATITDFADIFVEFFTNSIMFFISNLPALLSYLSIYVLLIAFLFGKLYYCKSKGFVNRTEQLQLSFDSYVYPIEKFVDLLKKIYDLIPII